MARGLFITIEGSEGTGKSSNAALLHGHLLSLGLEVLALREPGGTAIGEEIRRLLKRTDFGNPLCPEAELFLFLASRAQVVREKILPALQTGAIVLCDRYFDSTSAYQGGARRLPADAVETLNAFAIGGCIPDLTFLLDLPPDEGLRRIRGRENTAPDRLERESLDFFARVREAYLSLARREPQRFHVINAAAPLERVQEKMRQVLHGRLGLGRLR
jgi:dTMP kinase